MTRDGRRGGWWRGGGGWRADEIDHGGHFVQLFGADVGAVREPEINLVQNGEISDWGHQLSEQTSLFPSVPQELNRSVLSPSP